MTRRYQPKYKTLGPEFLLRGNLKCSKCGNKLTGSPSRGKLVTKYYHYHCNHGGGERFSAESVNKRVVQFIADLKLRTEVQEVYREMVKMLLAGTHEERKKKIVSLQIELGIPKN